MDQLVDGADVQRVVGSVSRQGEEFSSSFYASPDQIGRWCALSPLRLLHIPGAVLLLREDQDFQHVYHVAETSEALTVALEKLPAGDYSADLIGQGERLDRICVAYELAGFRHHAFLKRLSRTQKPASPREGEAEIAKLSDTADVAAFLERLLDRFAEQLPDRSELHDAAASGHLLIIRRGPTLAGMLMYEIKGQMAHLRFWHVDPVAHGEGVGRKLMIAFLQRCAHVRRIVLWAMGDNQRTLAIYQRYGFAADGLTDRIMTLHKDA